MHGSVSDRGVAQAAQYRGPKYMPPGSSTILQDPSSRETDQTGVELNNDHWSLCPRPRPFHMCQSCVQLFWFAEIADPALCLAFAKNGDRADFGVVETGWGSGMKLWKPGRGMTRAGGDVSQDAIEASFVFNDTGIISAGSSTTCHAIHALFFARG